MVDTPSSERAEDIQSAGQTTVAPLHPGSAPYDQPTSGVTECPMCKDPITEPIIVTPCGHVFDWICMEKCIKTREEEALVCPYCTNVIIGFGRDIDDEVSLSDYLEQPDLPLPPEDAETLGLVRAEDNSDERVPSDLSARQRYGETEVVRLQALEKRELNYNIPNYNNIVVRIGDIFARVTRHIRLEIKQNGLETISRLVRRTIIDYSPWACPESIEYSRFRNDPANIEDYEEVISFIDRIPDIENIRHRRFDLVSRYAPKGRRGLCNPEVWESMNIRKSKGGANCVPNSAISIEWETNLVEHGPANSDDDPQSFDPNHPYYNDYEESRNRIEKATEMVQGTLDWFESQGLSQRHLLDRGSTNLLEPCSPTAICEYCDAQHRNGDCLLPED